MKKFVGITVALTLALGAECGTINAQTPDPQTQNSSVTTTPSTITQKPALPNKLSGRWYTPDRMWSQIWGVENIDANAGTALMYFWSQRPGCSMKDVPVRLNYDGTNLEIRAKEGMACTTLFEATLKRKEGGSNEFVGELRPNISSNYPYLNTSIKGD